MDGRRRRRAGVIAEECASTADHGTVNLIWMIEDTSARGKAGRVAATR